MLGKLVHALASLKLTVVLLSLAMVLIFVGTLAQVRMGVWEVVETFFRSPVAWVDLQILVPEQWATVPGQVPFPGGLTIAGLMLVNLLAAHAVRFRLTWRRVGIIVLHAGLIVLIVGEFVTAWYADEGHMSIDVGGSSRYVEDIRTTELTIIDPSDPEVDRVTVVPEALLRRAIDTGEPITDERLPFDIQIVHWMDNARLLHTDEPMLADHGIGLQARAEPLPSVRGSTAPRPTPPPPTSISPATANRSAPGSSTPTSSTLNRSTSMAKRSASHSATAAPTSPTRSTCSSSDTTSSSAPRSPKTSPATCASSTPRPAPTARSASG